MSGTEYKVRQVAVATVKGEKDVRVMRTLGEGWHSAWPVAYTYVHDDSDVTDIRPLVVLDLDGIGSPRQVVNTLRWTDSVPVATMGAIADQIEAQTRPPKPAEPTGLGAVVVDSKHGLLVRTVAGSSVLDTSRPWRAPYGSYYSWADIDVEKVLSEGVVS